jgi:hypothetical protein
MGDGREVFLEVASIDGDAAGTFGDEDAGDGGLAAAGGVVEGLAHADG